MPGLKGVVQRMLGVQIGTVHTLALAGLALGEFLIDGGASLIGLGFAAGDRGRRGLYLPTGENLRADGG